MVEKLQEKIEKVKEAVKRCGLDSECVGCPYENQHCSELDRDIITVIDCLEAKVPRWISVEDEQKPQHHKEVLCRYIFDGDSECFYAVLTYYAYGDNGHVTGSHFTGEGLHDMRVTHWMPLPEPPKGGAE